MKIYKISFNVKALKYDTRGFLDSNEYDTRGASGKDKLNNEIMQEMNFKKGDLVESPQGSPMFTDREYDKVYKIIKVYPNNTIDVLSTTSGRVMGPSNLYCHNKLGKMMIAWKRSEGKAEGDSDKGIVT